MLECVVNLSEGRDAATVDRLAAAAGSCLLDAHRDQHHHRCVLTLAGSEVEEAARSVTREAMVLLDIRTHQGAHPRLGVVDVVPFVPLAGSTLADAMAARDRFLAWAAAELEVPGFAYGPERHLPEVRRLAFRGLAPTAGPPEPHPSAGAMCVGARPLLVAYNVWLADSVGVDDARRVAAVVRRPGQVRALGLAVGGRAQVSTNLVAPLEVGPADVFDAVRAQVEVERAELVGLVPAAVLDAVAPSRWAELDLDQGRTIESRLRDRTGHGRGPAES